MRWPLGAHHIPSGETGHDARVHDPSWPQAQSDADGNGNDTRSDEQSEYGLKDSVADAAKLHAARDSVGDAVGQLSDKASNLRNRLAEGTESFNDQARERIITARQRAVEARETDTRQARRGRERAADLFEEQPLIVGALASDAGLSGRSSRRRTISS